METDAQIFILISISGGIRFQSREITKLFEIIVRKPNSPEEIHQAVYRSEVPEGDRIDYKKSFPF